MGRKRGAETPAHRRSRLVVDSHTFTAPNGRRTSRAVLPKPHEIRRQVREDAEAIKAGIYGDNPASQNNRFDDGPSNSGTYDDGNSDALNRVLDGRDRLDISNAGGEFAEVLESVNDLTEGFETLVRKKRKKDTRTRRDRTARQILGFNPQVPAMAREYMCLSEAQAGLGLAAEVAQPDAELQGTLPLQVIDTYTSTQQDVQMHHHPSTRALPPRPPSLPPPRHPTLRQDSLRPPRRSLSTEELDGKLKEGASKAREDTRDGRGDYFIVREQVNKLAKLLVEGWALEKDDDDPNPCAERWKNMLHELTAKMFGVYDESGAFISVCRHGFILVVTDMVKSGELAKYPLAVVEKLLDVLGAELGVGYDIGCKFGTTLLRSSLGDRARQLKYHSLVGLFHGHAHNRLCQTEKLGTYVEGMGLEDLETCERFFSKSNKLANSIRYASVFHRHQTITNYFRHTDRFETYQSLTTFITGNYKQALEILNTAPTLERTMASKGWDGPTVEGWLVEEREYLKNLKTEPLAETYEMEYYSKLVQMETTSLNVSSAKTAWLNLTAENITNRDMTLSVETKRRHTIEEHAEVMRVVRELEVKLGIEHRWVRGTPSWIAAADLVKKRAYQRALDHLESLVVARMFELTKVNMAQTGYKMRQHIGKALQARSQAIRNALLRYNEAAIAAFPPSPPSGDPDGDQADDYRPPTLKWEEVVEYVFLSDFDLLRGARQDIREREWTDPTARLVMDQYFKIQRAQEEIIRLNIEIKRLVTYIQDEEEYLVEKEEEVRERDTPLAHQISVYRWERQQFTTLHLKRLHELSLLEGFTGTLEPGIRVTPAAREEIQTLPEEMDTDAGSPQPVEMDVDHEEDAGSEGDKGDEEDEEDDGDNETLIAMLDILHLDEPEAP